MSPEASNVWVMSQRWSVLPEPLTGVGNRLYCKSPLPAFSSVMVWAVCDSRAVVAFTSCADTLSTGHCMLMV